MKPAFGRKTGQDSSSTLVAKKVNKTTGFGRGQLASPHENPQAAPLPAENAVMSDASMVDKAYDLIESTMLSQMDPKQARETERNEVIAFIEELITTETAKHRMELNELERRDLITVLLNDLLTSESRKEEQDVAKEEGNVVRKRKEAQKQTNEQKQQVSQDSIMEAKDRLQPLLLEYIDASAANEMDRSELAEQVSEAVNELMAQEKINLNLREQRDLVNMLLHDMLGLGPLEPL
ncbi:MAG: hypothetical protein JKY45_07230, partial [Emcibacter sp.]|nr:hypothetical protein [Emcibacter sp.]